MASRQGGIRSYLDMYGIVIDEFVDLMNMDWQSTEVTVVVQHRSEAL